MRLDHYLVEQGLVSTRTKAGDMIKSGKVAVSGEVCTKPSTTIHDQVVELLEAEGYVSRAAYKLKGFLQSRAIEVTGLDVLDVGSSTGGFVEVLLEAGSGHVTALDVGSDQLHASLRERPEVTVCEQTDIREFDPKKRYDLITCDASFISLHHIIEPMIALANDRMILLFKPQFEVGREAKRDRKGVIKEEEVINNVLKAFIQRLETLGVALLESAPAALAGREGNQEFILYCKVNHP